MSVLGELALAAHHAFKATEQLNSKVSNGSLKVANYFEKPKETKEQEDNTRITPIAKKAFCDIIKVTAESVVKKMS